MKSCQGVSLGLLLPSWRISGALCVGWRCMKGTTTYAQAALFVVGVGGVSSWLCPAMCNTRGEPDPQDALVSPLLLGKWKPLLPRHGSGCCEGCSRCILTPRGGMLPSCPRPCAPDVGVPGVALIGWYALGMLSTTQCGRCKSQSSTFSGVVVGVASCAQQAPRLCACVAHAVRSMYSGYTSDAALWQQACRTLVMRQSEGQPLPCKVPCMSGLRKFAAGHPAVCRCTCIHAPG
jgi:hypothetical protein